MRWLAVVPILLATSTAAAEPTSIERPNTIDAPTGHLVPGAVVHVWTSIDSDGRPSADARLGLGDVAEIGIGTADLAITRTTGRAKTTMPGPRVDDRLRHVNAMFRVGIAADRLFAHQPAVALGFEKSFEHEQGGIATRTAALTLVASARIAPGLQVHAGGVLWDASIEHDQGLREQVRAIGGVELELLDGTRALADISWRPNLRPDRVDLEPVLATAVRRDVTDRVSVQSGVRLAGDDVTVLGEAIVTTTRLRRALRRR